MASPSSEYILYGQWRLTAATLPVAGKTTADSVLAGVNVGKDTYQYPRKLDFNNITSISAEQLTYELDFVFVVRRFRVVWIFFCVCLGRVFGEAFFSGFSS